MTHVLFDSDKISWNEYIRQQQLGAGKVMEGREEIEDPKFFEGSRYMRGYGVRSALTSIGRFLLPIASNMLNTASDEASAAVVRTADDWMKGKNFVESAKERGKEGLKTFGAKIQQCGKGKRKKRHLPKVVRQHVGDLGQQEGDMQADPIVSGPNPIPRRKRKKDYLDLN